MQATRQLILQILKERGEATVDEIVECLQPERGNITAVTVRHHLNRLQLDGLITFAKMRRRATPGRPQHLYTLTDQGETRLPNNFKRLAGGLLNQINQHLSDSYINVILEGITSEMADEAHIPQGDMQNRLNAVVTYLNQHGYDARWYSTQEGYILETCNCPYHDLSHDNQFLCQMDMRLISKMLGTVPRMTSRVSDGDETCAYFISDVYQMSIK